MLRLAFGDFELDEARFELRHQGRAVALQPKVLDLVLYLARHRDRVVTKIELFDTVWKGTAVTEASLNQAVSLARRALSDTSEAQHTVRTVRSKGLQFVASVRVTKPSDPAPARVSTPVAARGAPSPPSTAHETAEERAGGAAPAERTSPCLTAVLHCEAPALGGAAWLLDGIDEVEIGRGSSRRAERTPGVTRVLAISLPGSLLSRKHARITRTPHGWLVVDQGSRNGTFVGGQRIDKRLLAEGDVVDCGRTLFRFTTEKHRCEGGPSDLAEHGSLLGTVTPPILDLDADLQRIAPSDVPVLLLGESGTGKSHVAEAIHRLSGRSRLVRFDVDADPDGDPADTTLLIENVEAASWPRVQRVLETAPALRLVATSLLGRAELEARLPPPLQTRLAGFVCELPPLRRRIADLGVLAARFAGAGRVPELGIEAGRALLQHAWPGNLRELGHRLKVATSLAGDAPLRVAHLLPDAS